MMKMMNTTDHVMNFATPPYNWGCLPRCSGADTAADIPGEQGSHYCAGCRESPPRLAALCGPAKLVAAAATGRGLPPGSAVSAATTGAVLGLMVVSAAVGFQVQES